MLLLFTLLIAVPALNPLRFAQPALFFVRHALFRCLRAPGAFPLVDSEACPVDESERGVAERRVPEKIERREVAVFESEFAVKTSSEVVDGESAGGRESDLPVR